MNQYQANYLSQNTLNQEPAFYMNFLYYLVLPLILGSAIDIGLNRSVGPQTCSFNGQDKICNVFGAKIPSWVREISRVSIQLCIIFAIVYFAKAKISPSNVFPVLGLVLFMTSQPELVEDFRRFINSILFIIKYQ